MSTGSAPISQPEQERPPHRTALVFLQRWAIHTLAMLMATQIVTGIDYETVTGLLVASLLFGILHAFLRPLIFLLTLPLVVVTLGLFVLVINAGLLLLVGTLVKGFTVKGFWPAFWGALLISVLSVVLNTLTGTGDGRLRVRRTRDKKNANRGGDGPVIDV